MKGHAVGKPQLAVFRAKCETGITIAVLKNQLFGNSDSSHDLDRRVFVGLHIIDHFHIIFEECIDLARADPGEFCCILLERRDLDT